MFNLSLNTSETCIQTYIPLPIKIFAKICSIYVLDHAIKEQRKSSCTLKLIIPGDCIIFVTFREYVQLRQNMRREVLLRTK